MNNSILQAMFVSLLVVSSSTLFAEDKPAQETVVGSLPYEVIVTPTINRQGLRALITQVEDDFFEKFNELNIDDYYDVICYKYTPTMSHISKRVCEPRFIMETRNLNANDVTMLIGSVGKWSVGSAKSAFVFTPRTLHKEKRTDYEVLQDKMEELTRSDSEFRSIGNALAELKSRLENYDNEE
jgi:hypothetical protein